ncbi:DUF885 family protein [Sandarakinorhabdus sp. DWP1-3-1]|uniref:DUF885 family protein n=1 Tax=Sandarakinorhabdus sp. DWP1-3-1 TaxID=2804627 RepID=UPI003CF13EDE
MPDWRAVTRALTLPMAVAAAAPAAASDYAALAGLHTEWRAFQKGPVRNGAPDYSPAALATQAAGLKRFQQRLAALDIAGWSVAQKIDYNLVRAEMNGLDFDLRVARPWQRDPAWYMSIWSAKSDTPSHEGPVHAMPIELWTYDVPLSPAASAKLTRELAHIPPLLADAPGQLTGNARDLWTASLRNIAEQRAALADLATQAGTGDPALTAAIAAAARATADFETWVKAEAPKKTGPSGVGKENYSWFLKNVQLSPNSWDDEVAILSRELARSHAALRLEEHRNRDLPPLVGARNAAEYDALQRRSVTKFVDFLDKQQILTTADYMVPALLEQIGTYKPPSQQDFFQIVRTRAPLTLFTHFYHWFDLAREVRTPNPSPIRSQPLLYNIWLSRAEGQATAFEEAMLHAGLFDDDRRAREIVWIMQAQRAARGLASLYAQANMIDLAAAMKMQVDRTPNGFMSADLPLLAFEQQTYLRMPGYGPSYITGKAMVDKLFAETAEARGAAFKVRDFYDEFNRYGMIPVPLIRWQMLGRDDEVKAMGLRVK